MTLSRLTRPVLLVTTLVALGAGSALVPAPAQATSASRGGDCTLWRSTGAALTGFARCTSFDGYPRFQVRVTCKNGATVSGPVVRMGQTTWASCSSAQGYVAQTTVLARS